MEYSFKEHQKNILIGVVAGILSGVFLAVYQEWANKGIWAWLVPLFVLIIYYILISLITYPISKRLSKK